MSVPTSAKSKIVCGVFTLLVTISLVIGSPILLIVTIFQKLTWKFLVLSLVLFIMGIVFFVITVKLLFTAGKEIQNQK